MEVGRRSDNEQIRWESNGNLVSSKKMAKSPLECANTSVLPTDPPGNGLRCTDATATSLHQVKAGQVTRKSDIIDELLEAFQRKWMTLRSNKGRVQSTTIWRNGNMIFEFILLNIVKLGCRILRKNCSICFFLKYQEYLSFSKRFCVSVFAHTIKCRDFNSEIT